MSHAVASPAPPDGPPAASAADVARDLARKCVALAIGSDDPHTYKMLTDLSAIYAQCAALLDAEDGAGGATLA